jgi:hypothetical protein
MTMTDFSRKLVGKVSVNQIGAVKKCPLYFLTLNKNYE